MKQIREIDLKVGIFPHARYVTAGHAESEPASGAAASQIGSN